ncbi:hypothetical protein J4E83_010930 [Alternaria metachromatica]|uniref:uncharacterized protein n=1 Tax=Alternaria metachromatica TaxID=283354 RepID=UPI0020C1DDA7|nr:uncharacterized protein J4E83_010930 [Alternaria metachromatica]KAI4604882.1 hypothetical protein J4E83_010930 [Alternaria metachromatica]
MQFSLTSLFPGLASSFSSKRPQDSPRTKLRKTPPAPNIVNDLKSRDRASKQDTNIPTVLSIAYENFRARFARQLKNEVLERADTSHEVVASQTAARLLPSLNVISGILTIIETLPELPQRLLAPETTTDHGEGWLKVVERDCGNDHSAFVALIQRESAVSPSGINSDDGFEDYKSSTPKSDGSITSSLTSACPDSEALDRADWEPLRALDHSNFQKTLWQHLNNSVEYCADDYIFCGEHEGGYNFVRIYRVTNSPNDGEYVVKIPCVGTAARWQKQDAYMMRSEFGTIKFIGERTKCPVPEVVAYDDKLDNTLGAPYILMKACTGRSASEVWHDAHPILNNWDEDTVDFPSAELASKRSRMLRSLAQAMAELRHLEFDEIGALCFDNVDANEKPTVGSLWECNIDPELIAEDMATEKALTEKPVYDSSLELYTNGLLEAWPCEGRKGRPGVIHGILDAMFRSDAFAKSVKPGESEETFVLRHDDLNLQNVFCDPDTGEVTGIIDWERASTAPRCLGYSSLPKFLTLDWMPGYEVLDAPHSPLSLQMYREIYADAMIKATGVDGDGKYTSKSAMYQAAHAALFGSSEGGDLRDFVRKLLHEVPGLHHTDLDLYLTWLGEHWDAVGSSVKDAVRKVAKPVIRTIDCGDEV